MSSWVALDALGAQHVDLELDHRQLVGRVGEGHLAGDLVLGLDLGLSGDLRPELQAGGAQLELDGVSCMNARPPWDAREATAEKYWRSTRWTRSPSRERK